MFVTTRSLQRDPVINRIFDVLGSLNGDSTEATWVPPVDIFEDAEGLRIIAEVPGVKPEDVKISLEDNVLTIKGAKQQVAEERTERVHRYERTYGTFERSFTLPATVDASNIKASYEHGVLTVTLPSVGAQRAAPLCVKEIPQLCFHLGVRDGRRARFARRAQQLHLDV